MGTIGDMTEAHWLGSDCVGWNTQAGLRIMLFLYFFAMNGILRNEGNPLVGPELSWLGHTDGIWSYFFISLLWEL